MKLVILKNYEPIFLFGMPTPMKYLVRIRMYLQREKQKTLGITFTTDEYTDENRDGFFFDNVKNISNLILAANKAGLEGKEIKVIEKIIE